MFNWRSMEEWKRLWRYYQAGIVNMAFGFGLYALLVWLGLGIYEAQIISHILGMAFNYFTYSRYTFVGDEGSKIRFTLSYIGNYFLNLAMLAAASHYIGSPYLAGFLATLIVSVINYFILKRLVFARRTAP